MWPRSKGTFISHLQTQLRLYPCTGRASRICGLNCFLSKLHQGAQLPFKFSPLWVYTTILRS